MAGPIVKPGQSANDAILGYTLGPNVPSNPDPFNWKKIAADLAAQQQTQQAAKKKVQAAPTIRAARAPAAPAAPPPSAKALLDAYRAMNNGALPAGMTPEQAALIDAGIDINAMAATNPAMANLMTQIQAQLGAVPGEYAAGKAAVNANYDRLTGDILQSGKNWMQDLYGRIIDPNDPNAALAQKDPALTDYSKTMSQLDETADLNQATDVSWFDKMQQNTLDSYKNMMIQLAAQAATPAKAGGGGGGGRRGRHGGRGGGGGGSVNNWKVPTNTLTNLQSATDTATDTNTEFAPDFYTNLMQAANASGDPDLEAFVQAAWNTSGQTGVGPFTTDIQKSLTSAQERVKQLTAQEGLNKTWEAAAPSNVQKAINKLKVNYPGAIIGDDPTTPQKREEWYIPDTGTNTPAVIQPTPQQQEENTLAEQLLGARNRLFEGFHPKKFFNLFDPNRTTKEQQNILREYGTKKAIEASKGDTPEVPFNWKGYAAGGGYVPPADPEDLAQQKKNIDYYGQMLDFALGYNPNATMAATKRQLVSQGKDSSTYQTKNTNKSFFNALPGSPWDLSPGIPEPALQSNPVSNPQGFDITQDASGKEDVNVSSLGLGFGESRSPKLANNLGNLLKKRADDAMKADAIKSAASSVLSGWWGGNKSIPASPRKVVGVVPATTTTPTRPAPVTSSTSPWFAFTPHSLTAPKTPEKKQPAPKKTTPAPKAKQSVASMIKRF